MSKRDYYEVLGVAKSAEGKEIKKAYRKMAMKFHPDETISKPNSFKEVNEAYEVLSDDQKRATYDQYGHEAVSGQGGGFGAGGGAGGFSDIFGDVFGDIFGGGGAVVAVRCNEVRTYDTASS